MKKTIRTNKEINKFSLNPKKEWVYEDEIQERVSENYDPYGYINDLDEDSRFTGQPCLDFNWESEE